MSAEATNNIPISMKIMEMSSRVLDAVTSDLLSSLSHIEIISRCVQVSNASISFLASLTMALMIAHRRNGGLSTPYRRIVFGLSVSDILQSLAMLTGPWSVEPTTILSHTAWGRGNDTTCRLNGFLFAIGSSAVPMYTCLLCIYYLYKLKYRLTDEQFQHRIERWAHFFIMLYNVTVSCAALALDVYHTTAYGSFCYFAVVPLNCRYEPDVVGECDPTIRSRVNIFIAIMSVPIPTLCLIVIVVIMIVLFCHAFATNRIVEEEISDNFTRRRFVNAHASRRYRRQSQSGNDSSANGIVSSVDEVASESADDNNEDENYIEEVPKHNYNNPQRQTGGNSPNISTEHETTMQLQVRNLSRLYKRESILQASCYVGTFLITYITVIITYWKAIIMNEPSNVMELIGLFLFPLGGLFNILVYARPKAAFLRRRFPEYSIVKSYWLVLRAGGELPKDIDSGDARHGHNEPVALEGEGGLRHLHNPMTSHTCAGLPDIATPSVHLSNVMLSSVENKFTSLEMVDDMHPTYPMVAAAAAAKPTKNGLHENSTPPPAEALVSASSSGDSKPFMNENAV